MAEKLALLGGKPVFEHAIPSYSGIGEEEAGAIADVIHSGCLSGFMGSPGPEFNGGPKVQEFERAWEARYSVNHAISVNSNTSGLIAAMGAVGISPGDEVILPAWSMSATAMAPIFYGGIPVFADVEAETFCIEAERVEYLITPKTRAIIAVNLFGHPAELSRLRAIADAHEIYLIEDNAQAPLGEEHNRLTGTIGHIGVFSLNRHKHIQTGEGGVCVTNDADLALKLQLIRNHGENLVDTHEIEMPINLIGFNFRMTELSAAIGIRQLLNVDRHVSAREGLAEQLTRAVSGLPGIVPPVVRDGCRHNYYIWMVRYDSITIGVERDVFSQALSAEGFPNEVGYLAPLYLLPAFQKRIAIGRDGWPFTLSNKAYSQGDCPTVEQLHEKEALLFEPCAVETSESVTNGLIEAFQKVYEGRDELANWSAAQKN